MLQIRLNKGPSLDGGSGVKSLPVETVTVACPDHLVIADLPVAKGLGSATSASRVKTVGRRSRRQLGERVHFCVRCDFPIAIYGRLTPCEHAFCLDCARSDSICYLCDERIQKIQTIKMTEGIFICAAPHCLKSFLKKTEFESHIHGRHAELLQPNIKKEEFNESDIFTVKPSAASESSLRPLQKPGFTHNSNPPLNDREDKARSQQSREQTPLRPLMQPRPPPYYGQNPNTPSEIVPESGLHRPDGFNPQNRPTQQNFDALSDKPQGPQQGIVSDPPHYPPSYYQQQPPNFIVPVNPGQMQLNRPQFGFPPFPSDGAPFYGTAMNYEGTRSDSTPDFGSAEQGSFLGFPPGTAGPPGFSEIGPHPWGAGPSGTVPFEAMEQSQAGNPMDSRDGKGTLPSMPPPPPPGPPPPHLLQQKHDNYFPGDTGHDGKNYGWSQQKRDGFGSS